MPLWLADSSGIFFYGEAGPGDPRRGVWAVSRTGGAPRPFSARYGAFAPDRRLVAYREGTLTRIALLDGTVIGTLANEGQPVWIAPANDRLAWLAPAPDVARAYPALEPPYRVAVARPDGSEARVLPPVIRTEQLLWFPDGKRLLFSGRDAAGEQPGLLVLDTDSGAVTRLADGLGLESPLIAPDGQAIVYTATLQSDPAANGIWLIGADGSKRRRLAFSGGYRWAPDSQSLLYVPAPSDLPTDELWRYRLAGDSRFPVVGSAQTRFTIAEDDWEVAPDGTAIVYHSADDGAIWLLALTP